MKRTLKKWLFPEKQLYCLLCGRDKFIRKTPHICNGVYRKRRIIWGYKNILTN